MSGPHAEGLPDLGHQFAFRPTEEDLRDYEDLLEEARFDQAERAETLTVLVGFFDRDPEWPRHPRGDTESIGLRRRGTGSASGSPAQNRRSASDD